MKSHQGAPHDRMPVPVPPVFRPNTQARPIVQAKLPVKQQAPAPARPAQMKAAGHGGRTRIIMRSSAAASGKTVHISEDHVGTAAAADTINFGAVTSCMTITCLLDDGSKVAAHLVQEGSPTKTFLALKAALQGKTVSKVAAVGDGASWGPKLKTSGEIISAVSDKSYMEQLAWMEDNRDKYISGAREEFEAYLLGQLGDGSTKFAFRQWDYGNLSIGPKDI